MSSADARPKLAAKARLRFDRHEGQHMLIYPEKGMTLNATAAAVAELCTGEHSVAEIIEQLAARHAATPRERVEHDVLAFLEQLALRGLLRESP